MNPKKIIIIVLFTVFACEMIIMSTFHMLGVEENLSIIIIDSILLTLAIVPLLFFFIYKPMIGANIKIKTSEKRIRELVNNIPGMAYRGHPDWSSEILSNSEQLCGYSLDEINYFAKGWLDIVHPGDRGRILAESDNILTKKVSVSVQIYRIISKSGDIKRVEDHKKSFFSDNGKFLGIDGIVFDITERESTKELLSQTKDDFEEFFETINDAITIHDRDFNIIRANKAAEEMLGLTQYQILTQKCFDSYHGTNCAPAGCPSCSTLHTGTPTITEVFEPHINKYIEVKALPRLNEKKELIGLMHVVRDIDARKKAENEQQKLGAQLLQSQKMESVGRLAGGIAHDFNNLLTVIIGYSELALDRMPADNPIADDLLLIKNSGEKAAGLTRQLLAFSRKQVLEMKPLHLDSVVINLSDMMARMIGENIKLDIRKTSTRTIEADQDQIEQVLMNLAINARDAMPDGGRLLIEFSEVEIDSTVVVEHEEIEYGPYVILTVTDNGCGMTKEVQKKLFEPFFTTKTKDKGTGLGLATVYGIIKQHKGYIYVCSEPDKGATFKIYLPISTHAKATSALQKAYCKLHKGNETILVVEDEQAIRRLIVDILQPLGYNIIAAADADEALEISNAHRARIDLLLTDVIMPGKSGKELADIMQEKMTNIKILYMTGYTDDGVSHLGVLDAGINLIHKPLTSRKLAEKVRSVLCC